MLSTNVSGISSENVTTEEESELATPKSEERNKKQTSKIKPQAEYSSCLHDRPSLDKDNSQI